MTEVTAAMSARDFGPLHAQSFVDDRRDVSFPRLFPKTRPACSRVEFRVGRKKILATVCTNVHSCFMIIVIFPAKRRLSTFEEADIVLLGGEVGIGGISHRLSSGFSWSSTAAFRTRRREGSGVGRHWRLNVKESSFLKFVEEGDVCRRTSRPVVRL